MRPFAFPPLELVSELDAQQALNMLVHDSTSSACPDALSLLQQQMLAELHDLFDTHEEDSPEAAQSLTSQSEEEDSGAGSPDALVEVAAKIPQDHMRSRAGPQCVKKLQFADRSASFEASHQHAMYHHLRTEARVLSRRGSRGLSMSQVAGVTPTYLGAQQQAFAPPAALSDVPDRDAKDMDDGTATGDSVHLEPRPAVCNPTPAKPARTFCRPSQSLAEAETDCLDQAKDATCRPMQNRHFAPRESADFKSPVCWPLGSS